MKVIAFDLQGTLVDHNDPPQPYSEVVQCLNQLAKKYQLVLVTEGRAIHDVELLLNTLGIRTYFQLVLHLRGTFLQKSDASAYNKIIDLLHVIPKDLIVVGDVPWSDILGGNIIGAMTIRIRRGKYALLEPVHTDEIANFEIKTLDNLLELLSQKIK